MKDYFVHVYNRAFNTYDNVYVLAASNDRARSMVEELYPDWDIMGVFQEDNGKQETTVEKTPEPTSSWMRSAACTSPRKIQAGSLARTTPTKKSVLVTPSTAQMTKCRQRSIRSTLQLIDLASPTLSATNWW